MSVCSPAGRQPFSLRYRVHAARFRQVLSEVCFDRRGDGAGCLIGWFADHAEFYP